MTYLVNPPKPIEVRTDPDGEPLYLRGEPLVGDLKAVQRWIVETDWWSNPVSREYWRVLLRGRLLCEVYRDLDHGGWFLERVWD